MAAKKPAAKRAPRWDTPTVRAVRAELRALDERKPGIKDSALAAGAIAVAKRLDHPDTTAAAVVSGLRALERALNTLHAQAPAASTQPTEQSELEQRRAKRAARRAAS
jgi:hypothetical protein